MSTPKSRKEPARPGRSSELLSVRTIQCLYCSSEKPEEGSRKAWAHRVCADCCRTLDTIGAKPKSKGS